MGETPMKPCPNDRKKAPNPSLAVLGVTLLIVGWLPAALLPDRDKIVPATDAPKPLTPEESRKSFKLPKGFRIELVASEPLLAEPTGMCFDARGRLFVCELHGYNLDGYYDILELNKTGVLDKAVRRIPATKEAEERAAKETYGTIKLLEDTKGDGHFDRMTVFADHLPPCYGVIPAGDGVIAICAPDIVFLADRDGDGKAEIKEKLFTGFGVGEIWTRISNPRWGADNWIYVASGASSGGTITGPRLKDAVRLGNTGFRFKPDGSRLEPVSGGTSGFGLAFDDWGDRFLVTNQQHALHVAPLPHQALSRNPYYAAVNPVVNICSYGHPAKVIPTSKPDPWRRKRGEQPEWVKFYGSAETDAGLFTSACAPLIYQADLFPEAYRGNHISCEPAQNLVHRCLLEPKGAGFTVKRAEEGTEFLTTADAWFRPVNLSVGPEGALYVVDMYREIIEDYSAIPRYLQQQYVEGLKRGHDKGRVWRILFGDATPKLKANLAEAGAGDLVTELASPNVWRRLTAQRLLVERGEKKPAPALKELAHKGSTPQARLHALYSLEGIDALEPEPVEGALGDDHYGVRVNALQLAERWLDTEPSLLQKAVALTDDAHPKVRLQLAFSLGESKDARALEALALLARREGSDPWMQAAILSAVPARAARLAEALIGDKGAGASLLKPLAAVVGARNRSEEMADLLHIVASLKGDAAAGAQIKLLSGLIEGLGHGKPSPTVSADEQRTLETLLESPSSEVKVLVLRTAGVMQLKASPKIKQARTEAVKIALDTERKPSQRQDALALLAGAPASDLEPLQQLLSPREPLELQLATIQALTAAEGNAVVPLILKEWTGLSPRLQTAVIDALCSRQDRLPLLLDAIEKKVIGPSSVPAARQTQLLDNPDVKIRDRAKTLLTNRVASEDRKLVLEQYREALALKPDTQRGKLVYEQQCQKCHQLNGAGFAVGPDLAAIQNRPDEALLIDILDPSSTITAGFKAYQVITTNGKVYAGTLAEETATSVTLRREKGEQDVILRRDIDSMKASAKSLMPDGLEKEISRQDISNLIGYLREAVRADPKTLVLFDDDPAFAKALDQGEGEAVVTTDDRFSGKMCLRVKPPQRFSPRIAGWNFKIVERPGTAEYRYLRLAWKTLDGSGIMLELADNGNWPDANDATRRIFSGKNTTTWRAKQISKEAPRDWVVVTVDLWKDFGPMTLTGLAPTAMEGPAFFDRIELLQTLEVEARGGKEKNQER
jgi:putative membrane-bound dehydrogenase-like protein